MNSSKFILLVSLYSSLATVTPALSADEWISIDERIGSIKGTYKADVAKNNQKTQQDVYLQLDRLRSRDQNKFLIEIARQPGSVQSFLIRYLARKKVKAAVPMLITMDAALAGKPDMSDTPFLRESIVTTISQLDGANNRKFFLSVLPANNIWVRRAAIQALSELPDDHDTIAALRNALLTDRDAMVRQEAASALGNFSQDEWAKQGLQQSLGEEQGVLQAVKLSLQKFKAN